MGRHFGHSISSADFILRCDGIRFGGGIAFGYGEAGFSGGFMIGRDHGLSLSDVLIDYLESLNAVSMEDPGSWVVSLRFLFPKSIDSR